MRLQSMQELLILRLTMEMQRRVRPRALPNLQRKVECLALLSTVQSVRKWSSRREESPETKDQPILTQMKMKFPFLNPRTKDSNSTNQIRLINLIHLSILKHKMLLTNSTNKLKTSNSREWPSPNNRRKKMKVKIWSKKIRAQQVKTNPNIHKQLVEAQPTPRNCTFQQQLRPAKTALQNMRASTTQYRPRRRSRVHKSIILLLKLKMSHITTRKRRKKMERRQRHKPNTKFKQSDQKMQQYTIFNYILSVFININSFLIIIQIMYLSIDFQ